MNIATNVKPDAATPTSFDGVIEDLAALRRDFTALMSQLKSNAVRDVGDAADRGYGQLRDGAGQLYDGVIAQGESSAKAIGRQIEERPVACMLVAFGIGFVASRLLAR